MTRLLRLVLWIYKEVLIESEEKFINFVKLSNISQSIDFIELQEPVDKTCIKCLVLKLVLKIYERVSVETRKKMRSFTRLPITVSVLVLFSRFMIA